MDKNITGKLTTTNHIALKVIDLEKCERFYTKTLGLDLMTRQKDEDGAPRSVWLRLGETILMLERYEGTKKVSEEHDISHGWHLIALNIEKSEREKWKEKLTKAGIEITGESLYSLYFSDPEGNRLALSHYPDSI